jgi:hypothetical protein
MAKIGTYPAASALGGTEELIAVQSAASVKITPDQFKAYIASGAYKTGAYTAVAGDTVLVASDTGTITITLPATPTTNDKVSVWDAGDNAGSNVITVARNGSTINGLSDDFLINMDGGRADFVYDGTTWRYSFVIQTVQPSQTVAVLETKEFRPRDFGTDSGCSIIDIGGQSSQTAFAFNSGSYPTGFSAFTFPDDWDGGTVEFRLLTSVSTTGAGNYSLTLYGDQADGADVEAAGPPFYGTGPTAAPGVIRQFVDTGWFTAGAGGVFGDAVAGDTVTLRMQQNRATDTYTGSVYVTLVMLRYTRNMTLKTATAISNTASMVTRTVTGTTDTILSTDNGKTLIYTNAAAVAVTLPDGLPADFQCTVMQYGAGAVTVTPATDTVNGAGAGVSPSAQYAALYLGKVDATGWVALS